VTCASRLTESDCRKGYVAGRENAPTRRNAVEVDEADETWSQSSLVPCSRGAPVFTPSLGAKLVGHSYIQMARPEDRPIHDNRRHPTRREG
jgi:hypothetical protein